MKGINYRWKMKALKIKQKASSSTGMEELSSGEIV